MENNKNNLDYNNLYNNLINKYGGKQLVVAVEELSELQKEICKSLRGKDNKKNLIEEMADVYIMLDQLKIYYNISDDELNNKIIDKNERTIERMSNDSL